MLWSPSKFQLGSIPVSSVCEEPSPPPSRLCSSSFTPPSDPSVQRLHWCCCLLLPLAVVVVTRVLLLQDELNSSLTINKLLNINHLGTLSPYCKHLIHAIRCPTDEILQLLRRSRCRRGRNTLLPPPVECVGPNPISYHHPLCPSELRLDSGPTPDLLFNTLSDMCSQMVD